MNLELENKTLKNRLISFFSKQEIKASSEEKDALLREIYQSVERRKRRHIRSFAYGFASVAVIALLVVFIQRNSQSKVELSSLVAINQDNKSEDIRLILASEQEVTVNRGAIVEYSQDEIKIDDQVVSTINEKTRKESLDKIIVPNGQHTSIVLSDGTTMWVNSGTTVVFPHKFQANKREIFVDGEIFLDVARNEKAPFIVSTYNFDVKVLGTKFNVNAYSAYPDNQSVVLASGKVNLSTKSGEELTMQVNQKADISSDGIINHSQVDAQDYILWTDGILYLHTAELKDIITRLSRYYNESISYGEGIDTVELEGKIDLDDGILEALQRIADAGNLSVEKTEKGYHLELI